MKDRIPFLATPGGKTHALVKAFIAEREAAIHAYGLFQERHGFTSVMAGGSGVTAGVVDSHEQAKPLIEKGWRIDTKVRNCHGYALVPNRKLKETAKHLLAEIKALPAFPGLFEFSNRIGHGGLWTNGRVLYCYYEVIGEHIIIAVPDVSQFAGDSWIKDKHKTQWTPPDCTPLKRSDFYRMKEEHEAKAKEAQPA